MSIYTIYKATNLVNGKSYIGFDSKWPARQKTHKSDAQSHHYPNSHFHNAIRKYGFDNFSWEVLYQGTDREHTLKIMEAYYIAQYNTFLGEGYNMTAGGEGFTGRTHSNETKQKMSLALQGKICSPETRQKMTLARLGKPRKPFSEETKLKISLARQGKKRGFYKKQSGYEP